MPEFLLSDFEKAERLHLLTSTVVPRPIALVTTRAESGRFNAAPFSFFNVLSYQPDIVALGLGDRSDGSPKDTLLNIRASRRFVVNLVGEAMLHQMNLCGVDFVCGEDEIAVSGLTAEPDFQGDVPRVCESPVSMGCTLLQEFRHGSHSIILGTVERMWVDDGLVTSGNRIVHERLDLVARLGGALYAKDWTRFSMPRITLAEWQRSSSTENELIED